MRFVTPPPFTEQIFKNPMPIVWSQWLTRIFNLFSPPSYAPDNGSLNTSADPFKLDGYTAVGALTLDSKVFYDRDFVHVVFNISAATSFTSNVGTTKISGLPYKPLLFTNLGVSVVNGSHIISDPLQAIVDPSGDIYLPSISVNTEKIVISGSYIREFT